MGSELIVPFLLFMLDMYQLSESLLILSCKAAAFSVSPRFSSVALRFSRTT